jgi:RimJ/RimL family protein N-acetyltransferase
MQPNIEITTASQIKKDSEITIISRDHEEFKLTFKKIFSLNLEERLTDEEFNNLLSKLSDEEEFLDSKGQGVFYKNSTDKNPLTFEDMDLINDIMNFRQSGESSDDSQLPPYVIFSNYKNDCKIVGYVSFYFYDGKLEPDVIIFKDFRNKKIALPIFACLITDAFYEIDKKNQLDNYKELYATVHPQNLPSRTILKKTGFILTKATKDENIKITFSDEDRITNFPKNSYPKESQMNYSFEKGLSEFFKIKLIDNFFSFFKSFLGFEKKISKETRACTKENHEEVRKKILQKKIESEIKSQQKKIESEFLLLVEVPKNLKNTDSVDGNYKLRFEATNKTDLLTLFKDLADTLEKETDYIEGIKFLRDPKHQYLKTSLSIDSPSFVSEDKSPTINFTINKDSSCQASLQPQKISASH